MYWPGPMLLHFDGGKLSLMKTTFKVSSKTFQTKTRNFSQNISKNCLLIDTKSYLLEKRITLVSREKMIFLHDNARPQATRITEETFWYTVGFSYLSVYFQLLCSTPPSIFSWSVLYLAVHMQMLCSTPPSVFSWSVQPQIRIHLVYRTPPSSFSWSVIRNHPYTLGLFHPIFHIQLFCSLSLSIFIWSVLWHWTYSAGLFYRTIHIQAVNPTSPSIFSWSF